MRQLKLSIDIDGVLANFGEAANEVANNIWPGRIPSGYEPTDWYWSAYLQKDEWKEIFNKIATIPGFWSGLDPYENNIIALRNFVRDARGVEVYFVTARAKSDGLPIPVQTTLWLDYFDIRPNVSNYMTVVPVKDASKKPAVMDALEITHSVDDYGPTALACNQIAGHQAFVLDRPWNRDQEYGPRVSNLAEFFTKLPPMVQ